MILDIQNTKNKLLKLGLQIEESIQSAKTDKVRDIRKESLDTIYGTLELLSDLQMSNARSNMKVSKLESYIEDINKDKFKQK